MKKNKTTDEYNYLPLDNYEKYYYTNDIDIASVLVCKKYVLIDIVQITHIKVTFVFKNHSSIDDIITNFWSNKIVVHPLEFSNFRKNLKSRIYNMKKNY